MHEFDLSKVDPTKYDPRKYTTIEILRNKAFVVEATTIDQTCADRSKWTDEQKAMIGNFICTFYIKVLENSMKTSKELEILMCSVSKEPLNTQLECKDWAKEQWFNRSEKDWYPDWIYFAKSNLKFKFVNSKIYI